MTSTDSRVHKPLWEEVSLRQTSCHPEHHCRGYGSQALDALKQEEGLDTKETLVTIAKDLPR